MRRFIMALLCLVSFLSLAGLAGAQGTLRIGMTASDIPYSGGQPDNGFEGFASSATSFTSPSSPGTSRRATAPPLVPGSLSRGRSGRTSQRSGYSSCAGT
jgi:hypothetical protein